MTVEQNGFCVTDKQLGFFLDVFVVGIELLLLHISGDHFTNKLPIKPVCNLNIQNYCTNIGQSCDRSENLSH